MALLRTIEARRKMMLAHHGASSLDASRIVMSNITAP